MSYSVSFTLLCLSLSLSLSSLSLSLSLSPSSLSPSLPLSFSLPLQGLRVQEIKEISPWEIIEGIKNSGPFQLSWFGATRIKRKPLKYIEQYKLIQHHTHQNYLSNNGYLVGGSSTNRHTVFLPDNNSNPDVPGRADSQTVEGIKSEGGTDAPALQTNTGMANISATSGGGNSATGVQPENKRILQSIRQMNEEQPSLQSQPRPLPSNFATNPAGGGPVANPTHPLVQSVPRPPMMHAGMMRTMQQHPVQRQFELMTPEQRNQFLSLSNDEKRVYMSNFQRSIRERRMMEQQQQQQQLMYRHQMHPRPLQVAPPMQMSVLQQQRMMPRYGPQGHMGPPPPPMHHPGGGYMMHGHHPGMFRPPPGPMYGMQSMHPRQPMHHNLPPPH